MVPLTRYLTQVNHDIVLTGTVAIKQLDKLIDSPLTQSAVTIIHGGVLVSTGALYFDKGSL